MLKRSLVVASLCWFVLGSAAGAQVTEVAVPFDSAGKVRTLTPELVTRFALSPQVWPVTGTFTEARLFAVSTGGHVLSVDRPGGAVERYTMSDSAVSLLRAAIDSSLRISGSVVTEERPQTMSQPVKGAFVRNQMVLTWALYGPLLASMSGDTKTGTALYLLATGASYFITTGISRTTSITRAQNHLATDGALRGWGTASGLLYAVAGDAGPQTYSAVGLIGALGGSLAGFQYGRRLTDSEAQAATSISSYAALTMLGAAGASGLLDDSTNGRGAVGGIVAAGILGYVAGPSYPRKASYTVTRGDVQLLSVGALLGAAAAFTPFADGGGDSHAAAGAATAGFVAGIIAADRLWARPFDHSTSDATQVGLGVLAGGLVGGALAVLMEPSASGGFALVTTGGILGAVAGHKFADPPKAMTPAARVGLGRTRLEFDPTAVALGVARVRGQHAIVSFRF